MLITGLGAALGNGLQAEAGQGTLSLVEGIAACAMLTRAARAKLPTACLRGGNIVGLTTLPCFVAAIFFNALL